MMTETQPTPKTPVTPAAMMHAIARRTPVPAAAYRPEPAFYDRHRWEQALIATTFPHHNALLLGWALAHLAGDTGYLAAGTGHADRLARHARLTPKQVRLSLTQLESARLIDRPDIRTWQPREIVRPIWLTMPAATARTQRPYPGQPG